MGKSISIVSQKGGVGKTITAVNLAAALSLAGQSTILVDCDPQGSATAISGTYRKQFSLNLQDALLGKADVEDILVQSSLYHLRVLPAPHPLALQGAESRAALQDRRRLKERLHDSKLVFDYIIIDTPAAFDAMTINAMMASDAVLLPLPCEYLAFKNIGHTLKVVSSLKKTHQMHYRLLGILLTLVDGDNPLAARIADSAQKHLGKWIFNTSIPKNEKLKDSPYYERPLVAKDINAAAARSYINLAHEILEKYPP